MADVSSEYIQDQINSYEATKNNVRQVNSDLDRDAFMNLLITEMKNQDPIDPVDNKEMMSQLASFSSLEQMEKMNSNIEELVKQSKNPWKDISMFLGQEIVANTQNGKVQGSVGSAYVDNGTTYLDVDGVAVLPEEIIAVR
ncbi:MAG: hypothetical protein C0601_04835 [Candidatus Muiribacterium halophilum]|uniref:Flagellar hook assembly protein FlgD n=1 Tax=Muiribacterium halophilum TaxID=2053465 RepID=A0A2N5ZI66_MUIH1|nr:MAG: hypothetical protein C0601_04835 [Candidatus Muirbacterium halophilum]